MGDLKLNFQRGLLSGLLICSPPVFAQESALFEESAKRAEDARSAYGLIETGDEAYQKGDFDTALTNYNSALAMLPEGAPAVAAVRQLAVQRLVKASLAHSQYLRRLGNYDEIETVLANVDKYAPGDANIAKFRGQQQDPIHTNPALTKEHSADVDQVRRFLYEAEGFYDLGKFDRAEMVYEDILRLDPYNKAARRGLERVSAAKSDYRVAARDQARAKLLAEVGEAWEQKDHLKPDLPLIEEQQSVKKLAISNLYEKLNTIVFPEVNLNNASLDEAIDYLRVVSAQLDESTVIETEKGVGFVINLGDDDHPAVQAVKAQRINLRLNVPVPMIEVLEQITAASKTDYRVDEFAIVITASGFSDPTLIRRDFKVPPDFLTSSTGTQVAQDDPFGGAREGGLVAKRLTAVEKLKTFDLPFPEGATATYNAATNVLTVVNTADNLALVESIVDSASLKEPVIVAVRTTVIDISQENLEELGFDHMLGEFSLGDAYTLSGGTTGSGVPIQDMIPGRPVTSGLRSGELANNSDGLDALLTRDQPQSTTGTLTTGTINSSTLNIPPVGGAPAQMRAPGALSLIGIVDNSAHQILMRALSQKKGTNLMVRPQVMTRPGQNAVVQSVIEFIYPEEYEPPEIPNSVGGGDAVVTPSHPTSFTNKDLGVSLEVLPEVGADREIIEVQVNPIISDFEGFVNYGSPITGSSTATTVDFVGLTSTSSSTFGQITDNSILMPLFKTIRGKTAVRIADGQTIVMGGLLEEVSRKVNDKVPVLGDLPLIGRAFQSNSTSVEKRSILIFVNVELLDPAGNPYRFR